MRSELEYKMFVEQQVEQVLNQMVEDARNAAGIEKDELCRAVLNWAVREVQEMPLQDWFFNDMKSLQDNAPVEPGGDEE